MTTERGWSVRVTVDGRDVLQISDKDYSGDPNVADFRHEVMTAAEHLVAFFGRDDGAWIDAVITSAMDGADPVDAKQIVVLPELQEVATSWADLFEPNDCVAGSVTVRRGRIRRRRDGKIVDMVLAAGDGADRPLDVYVAIREYGGAWEFHGGLATPSGALKAAVEQVIGCCP